MTRLTPEQQAAADATPLPVCPPNEDDRHEAECRAHDAEARRLQAAGDAAGARAAARAAAAAFCRIGSPARQKDVGRALWSMEG